MYSCLPSHIFLLRGKTGVGKTRLLSFLQSMGQPVLLLEEIAMHKGSAFGKNGLTNPQPDKNAFNNAIRLATDSTKEKDYLITEQKGNTLGKLRIPDFLERAMAGSVEIEIEALPELRIKHIYEDYFSHPDSLLEARASLKKMKEKMEPDYWNRALSMLNDADIPGFIISMLEYYDTCTMYLRKPEPDYLITLKSDDDIPSAAQELAAFIQQTILKIS
jgi:tRNA 2-selenouridine synthase